jgi:hypothetical protein
MPPQQNPPKLIGLWSVDSMYGPGGQADEVLFLFSDGTGRVDVDNPATVNALTFRWTLEDATRMRIVGERYFGVEDNPTRVVAAEWKCEKVLTFSIQDEETPSGRRMRVLRFEQPIEEWLPKEFGFCREDINEFRSPDFSWVSDQNRGYLGVEFGAPSEGRDGVVIHRVIPGSPADHAGIKVGDIIRRADSQVLGTREEFQSLVQNWRPSQVVSLGLLREGAEVRRELQLISLQSLWQQEEDEEG